MQNKEELRDKISEETERMMSEMNNKKSNLYNALEFLYKKFMQESKSKFEKYSEMIETNTQSNKSIEESLKRIKRLKNKIKFIFQKT